MVIAEQEDISTLLYFDEKLNPGVRNELQLIYLAPWSLAQLTEFQRTLVINHVELQEPLAQSLEMPSTLTMRFVKGNTPVLNRIFSSLNTPTKLLAGFICYRLLHEL